MLRITNDRVTCPSTRDRNCRISSIEIITVDFSFVILREIHEIWKSYIRML